MNATSSPIETCPECLREIEYCTCKAKLSRPRLPAFVPEQLKTVECGDCAGRGWNWKRNAFFRNEMTNCEPCGGSGRLPCPAKESKVAKA